MKKLIIILFPVVFILWSSCSNSTSPSEKQLNVQANFQSIQQEVFTPSCAFSSCHGGSQFPNLSAGMSYGNLVNIQSREKPGEILVVPGDANSSYLIKKLKGFDIVGERMPRGSAPLPNAAIDSIAAWINKGAPLQ
jgi:hypothetical protein